MKNLTNSEIGILLLLAFLQFGCQSEKQASTETAPINRFDLVNRHNVVLHEIDPMAAMSVGNGDFAFTADVTGMQTFEEYYYNNGLPLETRTTWTWHSFPNPQNLQLKDAMKASDFHGRPVFYASIQHSPAGDYFRKNPQPLPMGQISLGDDKNQPLKPEMIQDINQKMDLWKGLVISQYKMDDQPVLVETVSHPEWSQVAFKIKSE